MLQYQGQENEGGTWNQGLSVWAPAQCKSSLHHSCHSCVIKQQSKCCSCLLRWSACSRGMHWDSWGQIRGEPFPPARRRCQQGPATIKKRLLWRQHVHHLQHSRCKGDATSECTQLLHQHQHLDERGKQKMMHGHLSVPDCSGMKSKRRFKSFELHCCKAAGKSHHPRSILYCTGKLGEISQLTLTLTWLLSPLSHLPPHQHTSHTFPEVWSLLLCNDKIIIPRAAAAMATPATENKGNELVVQDWWEELGPFGDVLLTLWKKGKEKVSKPKITGTTCFQNAHFPAKPFACKYKRATRSRRINLHKTGVVLTSKAILWHLQNESRVTTSRDRNPTAKSNHQHVIHCLMARKPSLLSLPNF